MARGFLLLATGLLCSVSGVTENREESRSIIYSDWQGWTAAESSEAVANRVGSFRVGRPESEKFIGGLFDEWREIILPEFGRVDPLLRQGVRDKLFLNQESVDFNEYLRGRQADLLLRLNRASADYLTGSLTEGMEAGAGRHSFVRTVEWDYQSKLGKRRWQTGLNVVGALRETAADAIVWQLRGYAAKESSGGANVGLIYRRVVGEGSLAGANVFLDYEDHDYGSFSRWSLGGEVRGGWGGVFVNRYMVLSGDRKLSDGRTAYSRDGFDVATEFRVPKFRWVSGGLTYYRFDGEHGDADEKGFRYHGAFDFSELMGGGDFWGGLSFALEYDNGSGGDWGGKVSYRYAFDAATPSGSSGTAESFDPRAHFFDPVRREYAQRISRSKTGGGPPTTPDGTPILDAMATVVAGTASFAFDTGGTVSVGAPMTVMAGGSVVAYKSTATVDIRTEADSMVSVATSPWWAVRVFEGSGVRFSDEGRRLSLSQGTVSVSRSGYLREIRTQALIIGLENQANLAVGHPNRVSVSAGDLSISLGVTVATAREVKNTVDLLMATDEAMVRIHSPLLTVTVNGVVRFATGTIRLPVERGRTGSLAVLSPTGGYQEGYRYEVVGATVFSVNQAGVVSFVGASGIDADSTLVVRVEDDFSQPATATVIFEARTSLVVASTPATVFVRPTDAVGSPILTLTVSGGKGAYAWRVSGDGVAMAASVVSFTRAGADGEVRRVALLVSDDDGFQTVSRNLAVVFDEGIKVSGGGLRVAEDYQGVVHTVAASSQRGTVSFSSGTPGVAVDGTGGGVSLASTLAVGSDLVVTITVDAFRGGERVDHAVVLLTLTGVSVFVPRSPGILYARVGAAAGEVLGALSVGSVFGEVADPDDWVSVNAGSGAIHLRTAASSAGTVMVTLFAGDGAVGNNRPVVVTIFFYEPVAVVSPSDPYIVRAAVGRVHHTITPSGGSGLYNYEVVSPASGVALLSSSRSASSDVSVVVGISVTLEAVIRVSDAQIAANPAVLTTLKFFGTEGLSFGTFARRHYVPVGAAARVTLVSLLAVSGVEPYRFSEADANFAIESGSVLIFTGSSGSPANYSAEVVVTDSDSPPETATVRVEVSIYMPLSVSPAAVTHTISARRTGAVHTVSATAGSGTYGYATETMPAGHGVRMADNVLHLTEGVDGYLTVTIRVSEAGVGYGGEEATQKVVLRGVAPLSLVTPVPVSPVLEPDLNANSPVLTVSVGGGLAPYRYDAREAGDGWSMSGSVVLLSSSASEGNTLRGSIMVTDATDFNVLSVPFTMSFRVTSTLVTAPPAPPPDSSEMVSVHLHGSNATIAYSATAITLSEGAMTVASYPVTAVARFTSAESELSLHFRGSSGVAWTVILYSQETEISSFPIGDPGAGMTVLLTSDLDVVFEGGNALSIRGGAVLLEDRSGSIDLLNSPFVKAHLARGPLKVGMEYPTFASSPPYPQIMVADLSILEGVVSVDVAGALTSRLELDVEFAAATAEIFSEEEGRREKLTVPPVDQTVTVSVSAVVGETVSYTLSVANGERFSHRYNGFVRSPSDWTVSPEGVVGSPTITGVTVITVIAHGDSIGFSRGFDILGDREIFPISETWVIRVEPDPLGSSVTSAFRAVENYTGGVGTAHFEAMSPGVTTGASDGVPSLMTPLPGMNRVVTMAASDSPMSSANAYFGLAVGRTFGFCAGADDLNGSLFQAVGDGGRWGKPSGLCLGTGQFGLSPFS